MAKFKTYGINAGTTITGCCYRAQPFPENHHLVRDELGRWDNHLRLGSNGFGWPSHGWLASLTDIVKPYAPLAYGVATLSGALAIALTLALFGVFRQRLAGAAMRRAALNTTKSVNYNDDYFSKVSIKLSDFEPMYGPYDAKNFVDCDIIGPDKIAVSGTIEFCECAWNREDFILVKDKNLHFHNSILLNSATFESCGYFLIKLMISEEGHNYTCMSPLPYIC
ncbi:MAG: hypothetical protein R3F54_23740 [Alphaproteobacteria bacterium]